jgi:hypothetical protein
MRVKTDITTLSRVYPFFAEAGIEGILTGEYSKIKDLSYSGLCGALLKSGKLADICEIITGSEKNEDKGNKLWGDCELKECMEVVIPFLYAITVSATESDTVQEEKKENKVETHL